MDGLPSPCELAIGKTHRELRHMAPGLPKAAHLLSYGLAVDGGHHKQWFIEQALIALGLDMEEYREQCCQEGVCCEEGIAP